jgi:hypothetical protein
VALELKKFYQGTVDYTVNTSTVKLIGELMIFYIHNNDLVGSNFFEIGTHGLVLTTFYRVCSLVSIYR